MRLVASHLCLAGAALVCVAGAALAASSADPSPSQVEDIIAKFAAKEADFSKARGNYTYRQTARVMSTDESGNATGKWEEVTDIIFNIEGKRTEKVVRAPMSTLVAFQLDPGDIQDLRDVQPFVLTTDELPKYYIRYLGREQVDEIGTYVFAVKPKRLDPGKRYFEGEIWVDDRDLQIVKSYGRGVGQKKSEDYQYPKFETYREQVDGKYWFPTYTFANSVLHFKEGDQRMKMTVRYEDYKQFKSDTVIKYGDVDDPGKASQPPATPPKKQ